MSYFEKRPDGSYAPTSHPQQTSQSYNTTYNSRQARPTYPPQPGPPYAHPGEPLQSATKPPLPNYEAHHRNPHSLRYDPATQPHPKKKRKTSKFLGGTAFLLACAIAGFGGGAAAIGLLGNNAGSSVIYQSVGNGASADELSAETASVTDIVQNSGQSVVSIQTETIVSDMFNQTQEVIGAGSGVIISEDGLIITNNHVVNGAQSVLVTLLDGRQLKAEVLGADATTDVALLRVEASDLVPAVLADFDTVEVGDFCLAIGNPTGELSGTVTDGIVSALEREITIEGTPMTLMQMSAPVNPGNSGGGLFNDQGELIGIVNAKSGGDGIEGLGFAIPINEAMEVAEDLLEHGYVQGRPLIGISAVTVSEQNLASAGVSEPGLYINAVSAGSGAEAAGLQAGDRIVTFAGAPIEDLFDLDEQLDLFNPGDTAAIEIERNGELISTEVVLQEQVPSNIA